MNLCDSCSNAVRTKYQQEIYNTFFKNTEEIRSAVFCTVMQKVIVSKKIQECNRYMKENK